MSFGSNFNFEVILGQILNLTLNDKIIIEKYIDFQKCWPQGHLRSIIVGKSQVLIFTKIKQIIRQNEAFDASFSNKLISRFNKVSRGQKIFDQ